MRPFNEAASRNPSADPNPLDRASFYIEELKYGPGPGHLERVKGHEVAAELESLLREAGVESMTGEELLDATAFYGVSLARTLGQPTKEAWSIFLDGLMHGIALAAGIEGSHRNPRGQ